MLKMTNSRRSFYIPHGKGDARKTNHKPFKQLLEDNLRRHQNRFIIADSKK